MKWILSLAMLVLLASCQTSTPFLTQKEAEKGVLVPVYPPDSYVVCWVQPPRDNKWYPCKQKTDEELGLHGH